MWRKIQNKRKRVSTDGLAGLSSLMYLTRLSSVMLFDRFCQHGVDIQLVAHPTQE